ANARALVAAERRSEASGAVVVDPDRAGLQLVRILRVAAGDARPCGAGERIFAREVCAACRHHAGAVDEMAVGPEICGSGCCLPAAHGPFGGIYSRPG